MRSVTSWFNVTLFKKNLKRFWPVWALYLVIWMIHFPIGLIMGNHNADRFAGRTVLNSVVNMGLPMVIVFSLLAAMAVWSYLYNNRSACLMHQLPIRREGLFLTNYLSGLTFMVGPNIIVFVLTLLAELAARQVDVVNLLLWLAGATLMAVFFFSFATICAMFTGHILALPAFYAIISGLFYGMAILINEVLDKFLFGYDGLPWLDGLATCLTPAAAMANTVDCVAVTSGENPVYELVGWPVLIIYAVVGILLAGFALLLYRRRHMEQAGDVVTVCWMRPIFQYGVAFCCALAFGMVLMEMFDGALPETAWTLLVLMLICGAVGYFVASMLLEKSFRVFDKWKGCAVFLAVLVLLTCAVEFDLFGYEDYLPEEDNVTKVNIRLDSVPYDGSPTLNFEDPEVIRAVLAVHGAIVEAGEEEYANYDFSASYEPLPEGGAVFTRDLNGVEVTYTLTNGRTVSRNYLNKVPVDMEEIHDPKSLTAKMDALLNMSQVTEKYYDLTGKTAADIVGMSIYSFEKRDGGNDYYYLVDTDIPISNNPAAYEKVLKAIQQDLAEGNLGRRYLMENKEYMNTCLANTIHIDFEGTPDSSIGISTPAWEPVAYNSTCRITLQTTAKHTLAALEEAGVLTKQVNLLTCAQREAVDGKWSNGDGDWSKIDLDEYAWAVIGE